MPPSKKSENAACHAIVGSDEAQVKKTALEYCARLTPPDGGEFGADIIDGAADNADQATLRVHQTIEAIQTLPFFGGEKLVWLKNANFLGDTVTGRSASVLEAVESLLHLLQKGIPDGVRVLISATPVDKRRAFYKGLEKIAALHVFDSLDTSRGGWEEAAAEMVENEGAKKGVCFDPPALDLFVSLTGGDRLQIDNELEKLSLCPDAQPSVSMDCVRMMVAQTRAGVIFELGNAMACRELKRSLSLVDQLLYQGETAIGILLVAIIPTIRNLLVTRDLIEKHRIPVPRKPFDFTHSLQRLPDEATRHLPRKKDGTVNGYALGIAAATATKFSAAHLRKALEACLQSNLQMVGSGLDSKVILHQLIVRCLAQTS